MTSSQTPVKAVYLQVAALFGNRADLVADLHRFLPDKSAQAFRVASHAKKAMPPTLHPGPSGPSCGGSKRKASSGPSKGSAALQKPLGGRLDGSLQTDRKKGDPASAVDNWVQCNLCRKWRRGVIGVLPHEHWQCSFSPDQAFNRCSIPEERTPQQSETYWQVECILDERVVAGRHEYRVRWKGFGAADDTWEPASAKEGSLSPKIIDSWRSSQNVA